MPLSRHEHHKFILAAVAFMRDAVTATTENNAPNRPTLLPKKCDRSERICLKIWSKMAFKKRTRAAIGAHPMSGAIMLTSHLIPYIYIKLPRVIALLIALSRLSDLINNRVKINERWADTHFSRPGCSPKKASGHSIRRHSLRMAWPSAAVLFIGR